MSFFLCVSECVCVCVRERVCERESERSCLDCRYMHARNMPGRDRRLLPVCLAPAAPGPGAKTRHSARICLDLSGRSVHTTDTHKPARLWALSVCLKKKKATRLVNQLTAKERGYCQKSRTIIDLSYLCVDRFHEVCGESASVQPLGPSG